MGNSLNVFQARPDTLEPESDPTGSYPLAITKIIVKDVIFPPPLFMEAICFRRIPVGLYISISMDGIEFETRNKPIRTGDIEWDDKITLLSDPSAQVCIKVYASFELENRLGCGELFSTFRVTIRELLFHSKQSLPFPFVLGQDSILFCCSLLVKAEFSHENVSPTLECHHSPPSSADELSTLAQMTDVGHTKLLRYRLDRDEQDLMDAIKQFELALQSCPISHPCRATVLFNLATAQFISADVDHDSVILLFRQALNLRAVGNADRANTLLHLAVVLFSRSRGRRFVQDAKEAEELIRDVLKTCPSDTFQYQTAVLIYVLYLGGGTHRNRDVDLESLDVLYEALARCREGDLELLDDVISGFHTALLQCTPEHPIYPALKGHLGVALSFRFGRDSQVEDLNMAISNLQESIALDPNQADVLNNLAEAHAKRFNVNGNKQDLDDAIVHIQNALMLQPEKHLILRNLAEALNFRYKSYECQEDLDASILHGSKVLLPTPPDTHGLTFAIDHAVRLVTRFHLTNDGSDLETAIAILRSAIKCLSTDDPSWLEAINNIAFALWARFEYSHNKQDLDEASSYSREALRLLPIDHPNRTCTLYVLAEAFRAGYEHTNDVQDLTKAISLYQEHLSFRPNVVCLLGGLANALLARFEHQGDRQDLYGAILHLRKRLELAPVDDENNLAAMMGILARALYRRFEIWDNNFLSLDEAIQYFEQSLALTPADHPNYTVSLNNVAGALQARFDRQGDMKTAERTIQLYREALAILPVGDPRRADPLNNLGVIFKKLDNEQTLDEAILLIKEALGLLVDGSPAAPNMLFSVAGAHLTRYHRNHGKQDLDDADWHARRAVESYPVRHIAHSSAVVLLAHITCEYAKHGFDRPTGDYYDCIRDIDTAMRYFKEAVESHSPPYQCLDASIKWARCAEHYGHDSASAAYAYSLQFLDTHLSTTASISSRHELMKGFPLFLVVNAASRALRDGDPCRAVGFLEQGRTLLWTQMSRFHTRIDQLLQSGERPQELGAKFLNLSSLLNKLHAMDASNMSTESAKYAEEKAKHYERILSDWNHVVKEIRTLDGFSRFLLPPRFSDVQEAACGGPVIMLLASTYSCDAIIIQHEQPPIHIQLPTDLERLVNLAKDLQETVRRTREDIDHKLREILQLLWDTVVSPVVVELQKTVKKRSRIWWCPTSILAMLPIHAAGEYFRAQGKHLSQLYISSYTPSLSALLKARVFRNKRTTKRFAAIGQNQPPNHPLPLPSVEKELNLLESLVPKGIIEFSKVTSIAATKNMALRTLRENEWVHFSCHGEQCYDKPYNSRFLMSDEPLTLVDIFGTDLAAHEFAFLSACQTAVGDMNALDEVIHLAAGLQFSGVKSVIGTMWEVADATVGNLVEAFYKNMFADGRADCTKAAEALHKALRSPAVIGFFIFCTGGLGPPGYMRSTLVTLDPYFDQGEDERVFAEVKHFRRRNQSDGTSVRKWPLDRAKSEINLNL